MTQFNSLAHRLTALALTLSLLLAASCAAPAYAAAPKGGAAFNFFFGGTKTITAVAPTTAATSVVASDPSITSVKIVNNGSQTVYLGSDSTVTTSTGDPLYPNCAVIIDGVTDAVYAITATGTGDLRVTVVKSGGSQRVEKQMISTALDQSLQTDTVTIATTSNTDAYIIAPFAGSISAATFSSTDALAANDTNYVTFSITNLGQAGAGTLAGLAATDPNTTKATGGAAIVAHTRRALTLNGTAANLVVAQGDRIRVRAAATGTLTGTVTGSKILVTFTRTL